jgi:hypothetical protein
VKLRLLVLALASISLSLPPAAAERITDLNDQQAVAVTIYNENLALVKDTRKVRLDQGEDVLAWREVSARIRPETALLRNLSDGKDFRLIEQNFDFDLLTPQKLLEKSVGKSVSVIRPPHPVSGVEARENATVLATNEGVVLQFADRIETGIPGRLGFSELPPNLRERPTLAITFANGRAGETTLELSYLTGGLSWRADYVAELGDKDDTLDLNGWVTLTNQSRTTYHNAKLQLVAGDIHRVQEPRFDQMRAMAARAPEAAPQMVEESLFEYHLYSLERPTTVKDNQTKQLALLTATAVPARKEFVLRGADYYYRGSYADLGQKLKVGVFLEFDNREGTGPATAPGSGLGLPLPKGIVRVYKKDSQGNAQFVGEDSIDHTPKNETIRLKLGDAFDVTARKKQTDFVNLSPAGRALTLVESAYQIDLNNAKNEPVTVKVIEPMPGDWQILKESHPHKKETAGAAVWEVEVPAEGKSTLTYRVRVRF